MMMTMMMKRSAKMIDSFEERQYALLTYGNIPV